MFYQSVKGLWKIPITQLRVISAILVAIFSIFVTAPLLVQAATPIAGFGTALGFDGTDDYVNIPNNATLDLTLNNSTIEMWFKMNAMAASFNTFLGNRCSHANVRYSFHINNTSISIWNGNIPSSINQTFSSDKWYHIAFLPGATNTEVFINGTSIGSINITLNAGVTGCPNKLGAAYGGGADYIEFFNGQLDEVRLWNTTRTQAQIQANMYKTLQGNETGLVAYWPFEEGSGTTASDNTNNSNDGTLTNMDDSDWVDSIIGNPTFTTNEDTILSDTLFGYDADGDTLTYSIISNGSNGNVVITNANIGAFTYTPNSNFNGTDTFTYQVNDGTEDSNIATVTINITPIDDVPVASSVNISGTTTVGETLTGNYAYIDVESDPEGTSTFQWYLADDTACTTNQTAISGATNQTYVLTTLEVDKYVCIEITPIASSEASPGITVLATTTNPIDKIEQTISFGALTDKTVSNPPFTISAIASSGLATSFSASGQCTVSDNSVAITGVGSCTITATQVGDATYNPAPDVSQSFTVNKNDQTISFDSLSDKTEGSPNFSISATASSDLAISFSVSGQCTISDSTVAITGVGSCVITASQSGDSTYNPAPDVLQSFTIVKSLPPTPSYKLTVESVGGTVNGEGISCGSDCQQYFDQGTSVTLTATPANSWIFESWAGDCDSEGMVIMKDNSSCTANFIRRFTLTVTLVGNGTVTGEEIDCGDNCTTDYFNNTTIALVAEPQVEWTFEGFSGSCDSQGHVEMTSDKTCVATFIADPNIPNNGDGNVDGIQDSQQNNVLTIPDQVDGEYLTLEVEPTCSIDDAYTDLPGNQGEYDQSYQFPQGMMYFELGCAETDVIVYFHALPRAQNPILQKYGPSIPGDLSTLDWFVIPNVTYGTVTIDGKSVVTATYHLLDGQLGDQTGIDGRIIDPMGLVFSVE